MKKLLLIFLVVLCADLIMAENASITSSAKKDKYSHWSIMASGGFNMLITERMGDWQEYKWMGRNLNGKYDNFKDNFVPSGIFQVDYMFTPQFGLRFQYLYAPINKKAIYLDNYVDIENNLFFSKTDGQSHQTNIQLEVNMLNLFYRCRSNTQWGWYIGAGIGAMFYKLPRPDYEKYKPTISIPVNTSIEYSPISSLSIVFHAELDWYADDELNGWDPDDQVNDMGLYVGLGLRYNIAATKSPHVRINDMCSFEPLHVGRATDSGKSKFKENQTTKEDIEELQDKMDELEKRNRELQDKIELMNREIMERLDQYFTDTPGVNGGENTKENSSNENSRNKAKNEKSSKNKNKSKSSKPSSESSSTATKAPESSHKEPSNPVNVATEAPVESERFSPMPSESEIKQQQIYNDAMLSNGTEANEVIFDLKSSRVKSKFEVKIGAVAKRMLANKKLRMDIFAYIKKEDLTKENVKLATQRLEAIYYILVNRYQIDPNRVHYDIQEPADGDDSADIRCDMVYR
ncbi:MAG: hypothetical protein MJY52_05705 [Bacteroidaceae bacterium]|nr:hypothetical protein [Bacteroidaceae bacterium]